LETSEELTKHKAREIFAESMLLSWNNAETGEYYPRIESGSGGQPHGWFMPRPGALI
jgi:hypothetical protein